MSSYLVLARKYRPQNFLQLVGQEVLVRVLQNSIKNNRLHQAYMLHGIRGVGKTTTARIIAKAINCLDENARNSGNCCDNCENCRLIANSHHQDVIEIDAASRTDVEGIREIIDSIAYAPVASRFKIYIIDEVHMLSKHAFNALLKTLEEPPAFVKFIFATTEIREVPQTILSRCQRFDLRRLDEEEIAIHLENILQKEDFSADKSALSLIARASEGSVRDALSILDQALANNNHQQNLPKQVIEEMLGILDNFLVIEMLENILSGDFSKARADFNRIFSTNSDVVKIANELLEIIYKITASKLIANYRLDEFSSDQAQKIQSIAKKLEISQLNRFWQVISKSVPELKSSPMPKMAFEMLLVRLCHLIALPDLKHILLGLKTKNAEIINSGNRGDENSAANHASQSVSFERDSNSSDNLGDEDLVSEILRSFEGSKILS